VPIRYSNRQQIFSGQQRRANPWAGFPPNSRSMDSAPIGARPIKLIAADRSIHWGIHHLGSWREVQRYVDPRTGTYQVRMNGNSILPVAWCSS
jgi:hypothetical protein